MKQLQAIVGAFEKITAAYILSFHVFYVKFSTPVGSFYC